MSEQPLKPGDKQNRAVVDTVRSILDTKGHDVASISPTATVYDAIAEMARKEIGSLVVLSEGQLVGIVSERDYSRKVILRNRLSRDTMVQEIMTSPAITVTPEQTVDECLRIVAGKRIRYLPVLDKGELIGIVSVGDMVKAIIHSQAYTIDQLRTYIDAGYPS